MRVIQILLKITILWITLSTSYAFSETIAVFLPHIYSVKELESILKSEKAFSGFNIKVYARVKDLLSEHKDKKFDILLLPHNSQKSKIFDHSMSAKFTLLRNGKQSGTIFLVTIKGLKPKGKPSIAALDETGNRKISKKIVKKRSKGKIKRIKLVKKALDLIPMVTLANVDYILIDEHDLKRVQSESEVKFKVIDSIEVEPPTFFINSKSKGKFKSLLKLSPAFLSRFGYDKVREVK